MRVKTALRRVETAAAVAKPGTLLSDAAVLVGAATALAYAVGFAYEAGYCTHFAIPLFLITPTTSVILGAAFALSMAALVLSQIFGMVHVFFQNTSVPRLRNRVEILLLTLILGYAATGWSWRLAALMATMVISLGGEYFTALIFEKGSVLERLRAGEKLRDHAAEAAPLFRLSQTAAAPLVGFFFVILFGTMAAHAIGSATARTQKEFHVVASRPDIALVKSYGDLMIGIKFDENKKAATGEVVVFKMENDFKQLNITTQRIGPLTGVDRTSLRWD